jgi:hypothetical protein
MAESVNLMLQWTGEDMSRADITGTIKVGTNKFACCKVRISKFLGLRQSTVVHKLAEERLG